MTALFEPGVIECQVCGHTVPNGDTGRADITAHVRVEHSFLFAALKATSPSPDTTQET